ncbi:MAG: 50S ribosomal protein L21 [Candidatus Shapirobacteria bacterium]|jgi:large subunit ribosomal protein L21
MKYAVIKLAGSQYKVTENQVLTVNNLNHQPGDTVSIPEVLLTVDDDHVSVGNPYLPNSKVEFVIVKNYRSPKLTVFKYKAKSRYRKTLGFRHELSDIKITKISST